MTIQTESNLVLAADWKNNRKTRMIIHGWLAKGLGSRDSHVCPIHDTASKPIEPSQHSIILRGLKGALNWAPITLVYPVGPQRTLRKLYFHFLSHWMGYDRGDSFQTKWNSIWFKIKNKTFPTIISHSMWKEMEV